MIPTAAQTAILRSRPHATKLWMSVYQPTTILACRVNDGAITKGSRTITFDGVSSGSYLLIQSGMTLWVGTSAGLADKGKVRVRSATSSILTVAENSHINWADDDYLTVVNFYEINAVYPRIIQDPADATKTLWYKDYDVVYTNQNSTLGSFICMGSHYAGFKDDQVYYSASGTYNLLGENLSYHWFFEGATVTGSNDHTPGYITYATPGHYTTRLIVSGTSSGSVDVSYRHISIYDRPEDGTNIPILDWEISDLSGSRDQGGYSSTIVVRQAASESLIKDGSLVIIFGDDWYGDLSTRQSIGGNALGRSSIKFVGYIPKGSVQYNYQDSLVSFQAVSASEIMKNAEGFSISVQDSRDPDNDPANDVNIPSSWVSILDLDIRRSIYHYLKWHSTVLLCCDLQFMGTDRAIQYFDTDRTSIYDAVNTLMRGTILGTLVTDRQGKLWTERDIYVEPSAYQTNISINNQDWMDSITIEENKTPSVAFLEVGGIAYSGSTGTFAALLSQSPGVTPGYRGKVERIQGTAPQNQDDLNEMTGNIFAYRNAQYISIDIPLAGNYGNFDIAPQEIIPITVIATENVRGIAFTAKNFFIRRLSWTYNSRQEIFIPRMELYELTTGTDGDTITIPPVPSESGNQGFNIPPLQIPPITFPAFPTIQTGGGTTLPPFVQVTDYNDNGSWTFPYQSKMIIGNMSTQDGYGSFLIPVGYATSFIVYAILDYIAVGKSVSVSHRAYISKMDSDTTTTVTNSVTLTNADCPYNLNSVAQLIIPAGYGGAHVLLEFSTWDNTGSPLYLFGWYLTP